MNKAIGFIGLGVMGSPMAGHLSNHHEIRVFNRSLEKTKSWIKKYSGSECSSVKEISKVSDILFLCVGNDNDVREIISKKRWSPRAFKIRLLHCRSHDYFS